MIKEKNKIKWPEYITAFIMIATPLIIALAVGIFYWIKTGIFPEPGLKWNDEAAYLQMIKNCITTGNPVGYWGFNGNHAIVGTGGAWSPAIIWPYAIFAFIFPLSHGFVYYVNLFYITLANALFFVSVKPDKRQCIRLALIQATSAILILYLSVNMSEIFRYAIAIVIAGLLYRMLFRECGKVVRFVLTPLLILGAVQVYVFFAFCVPIYVFALLKKSRLWVRLVTGIASTGVVALGSYYLLHLISSNYNIYKTEALLNAVKQFDITGAVVAFLRMMKQGATQVFQLWTYIYARPLIPWHVAFSILLVLVGIFVAVRFLIYNKKSDARKTAKNKTEESKAAKNKTAKNKTAESKTAESKIEDCGHDAALGIICVYSVAIFYLMYMTLYSIEPFTFVRGTQIVVVFVLWLLALMKDKILFGILICAQAVSLIFLPANMEYFMEDRYESKEIKAEWQALEEEFAEVFVVDESLGPWANTVEMFTMEPKPICALPGGLGVNFVMQDGILPTDAGYLLFSKTPAEELNPEWLEKDFAVIYEQYGEVLDESYSVIYESEDYIVYQKR